MQRFQFRLERVLEWYRKKLRVEEGRLAACLVLVHTAELKIALLQAERSAIESHLLERATIPAADLLNLARYRLRARQEEIELAEERRRLLISAAEQRARVQQAQQRVKLFEKMRERRLTEYTAEEARELENVAADAYLARWPRRRSTTSQAITLEPSDQERPDAAATTKSA
jgi:flagellar export protein FliJ